MGEHGQVIKTDGDEVLVRLKRTGACAKCKACTAGLSTDEMLVTAKNLCGAEPDEWVRIELEHSNFLLATLIMYGIPLAGLMLGTISGYYAAEALGASGSAVIGFGLGISLMLAAFLWIKRNENRWQDRKFMPVAAEKVNAP